MTMRDFIDDTARSVAFLSRIPMPEKYFEGYDGSLARAVRAFPVAGVLIVFPAALCLALVLALGLDSLAAAFVALALQTLLTGALHEDGLCDSADGIGGGRDRERALAIMKDSRVGSFGAVALVMSFGLRASALAAVLPALSSIAAAMVLIAVGAISRAAMVWHWSSLPPARPDGLAASAGQPESSAATFALVSGAILAVLLLLFSDTGVIAVLLLLTFVAGAVLVFSRVALRKIGGHTGDTIGATQQFAEIAAFLALALAL
ncbi:adenosylcobinamide-GDP ribazoletransferase [Sinorhizobium sp. BG8]|uniref:adenosylcobinamide-GDP ribazoletransferase n=1 Tax=Sinorhizobium sp. BG8 TaxID=2613773 RepID=UPI00193CB321|nr:adenosylcobinamide-GDP ribazoletransferase [Sinorhizobium sp. BG8]QRM55721.1 adenosylcobinamide-GDP ribazoletransferase [Sinorhizobium sp. BG8]